MPNEVTMDILIDADIIAYRAAASSEIAVDFKTDDCCGEMCCEPYPEKLIPAIKNTISDWIAVVDDMIIGKPFKKKELIKEANIVMALSDDTKNWRKNLSPDYKANRKSVHKPVLLKKAREYLQENYNVLKFPSLEADDVIGIQATLKDDVQKVVVSIDKDFFTVPCRWINPIKKTRRYVPTAEANFNHMIQTLTGDTADNYSGCPSIGLKRAHKILNYFEPSKWWGAVVDTYEKRGLGEKDALVQARLARILRAEDYNFHTGEIKLWQPM